MSETETVAEEEVKDPVSETSSEDATETVEETATKTSEKAEAVTSEKAATVTKKETKEKWGIATFSAVIITQLFILLILPVPKQ